MNEKRLEEILELHNIWLKTYHIEGQQATFGEGEVIGVNFKGADLSESNLIATDLSNANLAGTDLTLANLTDSDLTGANLSGADLTGTQFYGAIFNETNFTHAKTVSLKNSSKNTFSKTPA